MKEKSEALKTRGIQGGGGDKRQVGGKIGVILSH